MPSRYSALRPRRLISSRKNLGVDYPWNKYSQIVVRDYVSGAMENTIGYTAWFVRTGNTTPVD
jgi:aminopeptidase N